jgi:pyruvate-formate lyase
MPCWFVIINEFQMDQHIDLYQKFTDAYKDLASDPGLREVICMRIQYPMWLQPIAAGDRFAGKGEYNMAIGFAPQQFKKYGYFLDEELAEEILHSAEISPERKIQFATLVGFWRAEETTCKTRKEYPESMKRALPDDDWQGKPGIAFPLYRMSGTQMDYDKLLLTGISGLHDEIDQCKSETADADKIRLYTNMHHALDLFSEVCIYYADLAFTLSDVSVDSKRKTELNRMEDTLRHIASNKPRTLYEAIQLSFLYCQLSGSLNFGRMDEYLGDFLMNDIRNHFLSEEEAVDLIGSYWITIMARNRIYDSRLTIGGKGRRNEENANEFALLAMEAMNRVKTTVPQISLRFYEGQDKRLFEKGMEILAAGTTYPILYNDDILIPAVQHAFTIPEEEAVHYIPFGCGEYTLYHRSIGTPSGIINLLQALLVTLHNGIDPLTGKASGLALGHAGDFITYEQLWNAYKRQVEFHVEQLAFQEELEYDVAARTSPHLLFSILYEDCVKRGRPIFNGGCRYLGGTLETYGNTNTADSLVVIKELVFGKKLFTLEKLITMLDADFTGYEKERRQMMLAPKYGNDTSDADGVKVEVDRHICHFTRNMAVKTKLHSYLVVNINNDANTVLGRYTAASPDGRKARTFMANGNAPSGGCDTKGATAVLNSILKPDCTIHAGSTQNLKFSRSMFSTYRTQFDALLKTYFSMGGAQAMITVVNRNELERALAEPENYKNLVVRVGGFSARFVDLPRDVQQEIVSRTLY